jgi:hypothetical protein
LVQEVQADPAVQEHHWLHLYRLDPLGLVRQGVLLVALVGLGDRWDLQQVPLTQVDQAHQVDQGTLVRLEDLAALALRATLLLVVEAMGEVLASGMAGVAE